MEPLYKIFHELFLMVYHFQIIIWGWAIIKFGFMIARGIQAIIIIGNSPGMFDYQSPVDDENDDKHSIL